MEQVAQSTNNKPLYLWIPRPIRSLYRRIIPRTIRIFIRTRSFQQWMFIIVYTFLQCLFNRIQFGLPFFGIALICAIFLHVYFGDEGTARKDGQLSAYSVFNQGQQRLPGTLDANEYDRLLRRGGTM